MTRNRFFILEALAFFVFISLGFWIGTNLGGANAAPITEQPISRTQSPLPAMPDGERIILLAVIDDNVGSNPHLLSLWLLTYYLDNLPIHFLPIYPSGSDTLTEFDTQVLNSFSLVNDNGTAVLNPDFLSLLVDNNYWLSGYIVFDVYAAAQMINLIGGIPGNHGTYSGEQILSTFTTSAGQPREAYTRQVVLLGQTCQTLSRLGTVPNWQVVLSLFPEHMITNIEPLGLISELTTLTANPAQIRCEFPFLNPNP